MEITQEISRHEISCWAKTFDVTPRGFHWHDKYEICQVIKNNFKIRVDGEIINASAGDIVAINEHIVHQFIVEEPETCIRVFQFPLRILLNFGNFIEPLKIHIKAEEINSIPGLREKLQMLFEMIEEERNVDFAFNNPFLQSMASSVYLILERYFSEPQSAFSKNRDRQEFYKITDYINKHFKEDITVESIAKKLFFSRGRLTSVFKKYAGIGLNEYINTIRIKNANYLLSKGTNVTEAALESGFQSIRTFNNVYKNVMGVTPSEYIKEKQMQ